MKAGSIGVLTTPTDDPLDSFYADTGDRMPAVSVEKHRDGPGDLGPVQAGTAAGSVDATRRDVSVAHDRDGNPGGIMVEQVQTLKPVVSDWVADPTGSGLVTASSLSGPDEHPFPFDLIGRVAGALVTPQQVDVRALYQTWLRGEDALGDVWMVGEETPGSDGVSIDYHDAASAASEPTIGVGFQSPAGYNFQGVVFDSGYVAVHSDVRLGTFARFVVEEVLPFCDAAEDAPGEQVTLGEGGSGEEAGAE